MAAIYALTTVFTPPASCSDRPFTLAEGETSTNAKYVFWEDAIEKADTLSCYPSVWSAGWHSTFSPGVCPKGYYTYSTTYDNDATVAYCCPSGFSAETGNSQCYSKIGTPTSAYQVSMRTTEPWDYILLPLTAVTPAFGAAYVIAVEWRARDLDNFVPKSAPILGLSVTSPSRSGRTPTPASPSKTETSRADPTGTSGQSQNATTDATTYAAGSSSEPADTGLPASTTDTSSVPGSLSQTKASGTHQPLPMSTIIAIVVGVCAFAILLTVGLVIFFIRKRRRWRKQLAGSTKGLPVRKAELEAPIPPPPPVFLDGREIRRELP